MTNYYDDPKNAAAYIKMAEGYDGRELIDLLRLHLPEGASLLELGMGPGTDLEILSQYFQVTGSDRAKQFLERYRQKNPAADLLQLDAVTMEMESDRRFDAIYSNKVLHHLTRDELEASLQAQARLLNPNGILLHCFWYGDKEEQMHGLHFAYYTEASLQALVGEAFELIALGRYAEMGEGDSLYIILKKVV
jgi:ubiquinone/menaquinone biosynthesis C-methylase UbiE